MGTRVGWVRDGVYGWEQGWGGLGTVYMGGNKPDYYSDAISGKWGGIEVIVN